MKAFIAYCEQEFVVEDRRRRARDTARQDADSRQREQDIEFRQRAALDRANADALAELVRKRRDEALAQCRAEVEAARKAKAEAEAKSRAEAEVARKAEAEAEAKRRAEAEAKRRAEAEAKRKAEAETKRRAEAEAKRTAEAAAAQRAAAAAKAAAEVARLQAEREELELQEAIARSLEDEALAKPSSDESRVRVSVASLGLADGDPIQVRWKIAEDNGIEVLNVWWRAYVRLYGSPTEPCMCTLEYEAKNGFKAEQRLSVFVEDEAGFPTEGSLLDITDRRTARLHWRRAEGNSGGKDKASAGAPATQPVEPAVSAPNMCRAYTAKGKPCGNKVHKSAGTGKHREHTCCVHKSFKGALQPAAAPTEVMIDLTEEHVSDNAAASAPAPSQQEPPPPVPPPPPALTAEEMQRRIDEAAAKAVAEEKERAKREAEARRRSHELALAALEAERAQKSALEAERAEKAPPSLWTPMADHSAVQMVPVPRGSEEWHDVVDTFVASALCGQRTASGQLAVKSVKVKAVERVQNMAQWQLYALKRSEIRKRENASESGMSRYERKRLWHGTDRDVSEKIASAGFNRSFAGVSNATRYGKGVYFARHAGYSIDPKYAMPDEKGLQRIFCCRVIVGEFAVGDQDILAPPERRAEPHLLFDSTVDRLTNPSVFVTFHDAQAYPEYLITFVAVR